MITKRHHHDRAPSRLGWLNSQHTFSFGRYYDPIHMGFGVLRVINEDHVIGGAGFKEHGHDNMEIISYVLRGALEHKDSMGTGSVIKPYDIQLMSAGSGVTHSEFNASANQNVHFLQMWVVPNVSDEAPDYQQASISSDDLRNQLRVVISPDGNNGALRIKQDARMLNGLLDAGFSMDFALDPARAYWIQIATGSLMINGETYIAGDGAGIIGENMLTIKSVADSNLIVFDLPAV
jgi:redox-sensitive bicupin YhaK (pirin superfamily)